MKRRLDDERARNNGQITDSSTEYVDDASSRKPGDSSDNCNENDDEKREFEEMDPYLPFIDIGHDHGHYLHDSNSSTMLRDASLELPAHPLDRSGCCGRLWQTMSSFWVLSLIKVGRLRPIQIRDLYAIPKAVSLPRVLSKWSSLSFRPETHSILRAMWALEKGDVSFVFMLNLFRALIIIGLLYLWYVATLWFL